MDTTQTRNPAYSGMKKTPELIRQMNSEIGWLDREMEKVKEQMKKKPSKIRHLNTLERQKQEKINWLNS